MPRHVLRFTGFRRKQKVTQRLSAQIPKLQIEQNNNSIRPL